MPVLKSDFTPSLPFRNKHFNSVFRVFFAKESHNYKRERINTNDNDFIDLDYSKVGSDSIAILIHGLEGSSESTYMLTASNELNAVGIDTVAINLRGCSGQDNLKLQTYHSGKTDDVDLVVKHILTNYKYQKIAIIGYSLGGNLTLKYMGEYAKDLSPIIKCAIGVSVPCDLASSGKVMAKSSNKVYMSRFLKTLKVKVRKKSKEFPDYDIDFKALQNAKNFNDFDSLYTAPVFGYKNAEDYWEKASSKPYLKFIQKPTILITSLDDPFLAPACFPFKEAEQNDSFFLEVTRYGGHVGFSTSLNHKKNRWLESRIISFLKQHDI